MKENNIDRQAFFFSANIRFSDTVADTACHNRAKNFDIQLAGFLFVRLINSSLREL